MSHFVLYYLYASSNEVLCDKFGVDKIVFNKCIIVSYLSNTFADDMLIINDNAIDQCIDSFINGTGNYSEILNGCSAPFIETVGKMIEGRQIESDYRVYFYNYPKNSNLYDYFELQTINTILYDLLPEENEFALVLDKVEENIIGQAIKKIHDLKVPLPRVALN